MSLTAKPGIVDSKPENVEPGLGSVKRVFTAIPGTVNSYLGNIEQGLGAKYSTGNLIVSQVGVLVITQGNPSARISQIGMLVIVPKMTVSSGVILVGMGGLKKLSDFTGGMN